MATPSFFFYDLETSGLDPKRHRIMQFAGRRTDLELNMIGEPVNFFVRLSPEVLPDVQAILTTGIPPQQTLAEGIPEREAVDRIMNDCFTPDTVVIGYNNVRFDDEFIRYAAYRNFWNAYEWAYADGRSRWDLLDVVRLVRALRPEGINWPVDENDVGIYTLEQIASANGVTHTKAHDAMSDVDALIDVARLIRKHQPKMFDYLLGMRGKDRIGELVDLRTPRPFIYTSRRYGRTHHFTTVAVAIAEGQHGKRVVWDLRYAPDEFAHLSAEELSRRLFAKREELEASGESRPPVKELATNKCPAVAPLSTLRDEDADRLELSRDQILVHLDALMKSQLPNKLSRIYRERPPFTSPEQPDVDGALYDGFIDNQLDKNMMTTIRRTPLEQLGGLSPHFSDRRLLPLWWRYLGRNCPQALPPNVRGEWESYVEARRLTDRPAYLEAVQRLPDSPLKASLLAWERQSSLKVSG